MERFAIKELEKWKNKSNRKPMVLMGARQVGKTWLMKTFGEKNYKKVAYISFYNNYFRNALNISVPFSIP